MTVHKRDLARLSTKQLPTPQKLKVDLLRVKSKNDVVQARAESLKVIYKLLFDLGYKDCVPILRELVDARPDGTSSDD